jgi:hypothetical protein
MEEFDTSLGAHANWPHRFFALLVDSHLAAASDPGGRVGDAWSHLFRARGLLDFALPVMERIAAEREAASELGASTA